MTVTAKCPNCNKVAPAEQFKLHYRIKKMVCADCFSGKTQKTEEQKQKVEPVSKPAGWDKEDEYLEKISRLKKEENQAKFKRIPGTDYIQYKCTSCKFNFRYNYVRMMPTTCPYCNAPVQRLRESNFF